jgi:hypothetical protein
VQHDPERGIERGFTADDIATVKAWLVTTAQRLEAMSTSSS